MSRETGEMTRLSQGPLPGRWFKDRLQSPVSCDPNLWLCLMGFASLCIVLWLFIWVKDILFPFMSEWLPPAFVHCEVFCALARGEGRVMLLLRRGTLEGGRSDRPSRRAASWGAISALWAIPEDPTAALCRFPWTWANRIFPLKGTFHCLF